MRTLCRHVQTTSRIDADKHKSLRLAHFFLSYANYAQVESCRLCAHLRRHFADIEQTMQTTIHVCIWNTFLLSSVASFLTALWFLQDPHGIKGTDQSSLLPGVSTGREAGRPRVVWQIRSSTISGGGLRRLTG